MVTRKHDDNSPEAEPKAELKNPDRRHLLGAAALAAFTVGQAGSAAAQARPAKKQRAAAPAECPPPWADGPDPSQDKHGPQEAPDPHPNGYKEPSTFGALPAGQVIFQDAKRYRRKVSAYAKKLRKAMDLDADFTHVIRLEHKNSGAVSGSVISADCGCGCS